MMNGHSSLEKHTSHSLFEMVAKGLCVKDEVETEQTATYWPPVPLSLEAPLSRSAGLLSRGSWGPIDLSCVLVLSTTSYLQLTNSKLTEPVCRTVLYNCLTPTCFLWASHLHPIQPTVKVIPWYLRPDNPVSRLTAGSKVNMLQTPQKEQTFSCSWRLSCINAYIVNFKW